LLQSTSKQEKNVRQLLESLRIAQDGVLLIHSSFKDLSRLGYKAETVIEALVDYMATGTLLMPTMSWRSVNPKNPIFDELRTPSITGILTEIFRSQFAVRRSLHPTHSVAGRGQHSDALLSTHHLDELPCSSQSPWGLLANFDAQVMLLGVEMDSCTLVHHVEQIMAPELYMRPKETREQYTCRDRFSAEVKMNTRRTLRLPRNFWQFEDMLLADKKFHQHAIENTVCRSFSARDMVQVITETLSQQPDAIIAKLGQRSKMM